MNRNQVLLAITVGGMAFAAAMFALAARIASQLEGAKAKGITKDRNFAPKSNDAGAIVTP